MRYQALEELNNSFMNKWPSARKLLKLPSLGAIEETLPSYICRLLELSLPSSLQTSPSQAQSFADHVSQSATMLSIFVNNIIEGPHVKQFFNESIKRCSQDTGMLDLPRIAKEEVKLNLLR
jgi:hypothetical protein